MICRKPYHFVNILKFYISELKKKFKIYWKLLQYTTFMNKKYMKIEIKSLLNKLYSIPFNSHKYICMKYIFRYRK